jgi:flagellar basal-body rod modification protein FlgD
MVSATTGATSAAGSITSKADKNQLDKDAFLKLLISELRNQDPLKPMDDKEFISQLAQFSSLEQMQSMNTTLGGMSDVQSSLQTGMVAQSLFQQAVALVGKTVEVVNPDYKAESSPDSDKTIKGRIDTVDFTSGAPVLKINGKTVPLQNVLSVSA